MTKKVYKVVWVDQKGRLWSAMKGMRGFFRPKRTGDIMWYTKCPLRYRVGKTVVAAPDMKPYLFAFDSVYNAVDWAQTEFLAAVEDGKLLRPCLKKRTRTYELFKFKFNKGYLEVWESTGVVMTYPEEQRCMYDFFVLQSAPHGAIICSALTLNTQVTSLV